MHKALLLLRNIPKGKVVTYKELARAAGTSPRAAGRILARNPDLKTCPCYKVVASNGELRGYSGPGGLAGKKKLLEKDGVALKNGRVVPDSFFTFPE
ncbi:MAG: MGMT family protein [Candidatus Yanofskybacteria bacterium]|nr:MGMT family protein [Candidatus Yanofskybacteria bacterium]